MIVYEKPTGMSWRLLGFVALRELLLKHSYFDPEYLQGLATRYAWQKVHEKLITPAAPTLTAVRRGDFGEAIAAKALEELEDYQIPINKLRYKVGKNQTLPGTDCLALKIADSGELDEVCFVESKLRTARDDSVAVKGYQQLVSDVTEAEPVILSFVARQLTAGEHPLAGAFHNYFFSRDRQIETYKLYLLYAPLLPPIASRNLLLLQSLPYQHSTSICQCKEAKRWALCGHGGERTY